MLALSALAGGGLLIAINLALGEITTNQPNPQTWLVCLLLLLFSIYTQHHALKQMAVSLEGALLKQRRLLAARLRYADIAYIEEVASMPTRAILAKDFQIVSHAALPATLLLRSLAVMVFILIYLSGLSPVFALIAAVGVVLSLLIQWRFNQPQLADKLRTTWAGDQIFFRYVQNLLAGMRDVRQSRHASEEAFDQYDRLAGEMSQQRWDINLAIARQFTTAYSLFHLMLIILLIIIPGLIGGWGNDTIQLTVATLYLLIEGISMLSHFPILARANAAVDEVSRLDGVIRKSPRFDSGGRIVRDAVQSFSSLSLDGIEFGYAAAPQPSGFALGPFNLTLKAGEWVSLTGANGSGKTTLLKLISGLQIATAGTVSVNGKLMEQGDYPYLRELFAVAWPDSQGALITPAADARSVAEWLGILQLGGKVVHHADGKWTVQHLSTAESKRLTLLKVILEDRPIILLDGITADQDAEFLERLYGKILPLLKKQGKTLVVVTQDEAGLKAADRVLTLVDGRLTA